MHLLQNIIQKSLPYEGATLSLKDLHKIDERINRQASWIERAVKEFQKEASKGGLNEERTQLLDTYFLMEKD